MTAYQAQAMIEALNQENYLTGAVRGLSASFDPVGRARRVEGGYIFSGRHGFSSGIDYAGWMICGGAIVENERLDGPHFWLVPKSDAMVTSHSATARVTQRHVSGPRLVA